MNNLLVSLDLSPWCLVNACMLVNFSLKPSNPTKDIEDASVVKASNINLNTMPDLVDGPVAASGKFIALIGICIDFLYASN